MKLRKMMLNINGVDRMFMCDPENDKLSDVLRRIGLTGVKVGCGTGVCGSCSIILNGQVIRSIFRLTMTLITGSLLHVLLILILRLLTRFHTSASGTP